MVGPPTVSYGKTCCVGDGVGDGGGGGGDGDWYGGVCVCNGDCVEIAKQGLVRCFRCGTDWSGGSIFSIFGFTCCIIGETFAVIVLFDLGVISLLWLHLQWRLWRNFWLRFFDKVWWRRWERQCLWPQPPPNASSLDPAVLDEEFDFLLRFMFSLFIGKK